MADVRRATPDAAELVVAIGMPNAYELLKRFHSHQYVYVPLHATETHRLALVLGMAAAQRLSDKYGGLLLKLPSDRTLIMDARNAKITALIESGKSYSEVGRMYGLTRQQIKNISIGDTAGKRNSQ
jgi:Mor family transcriptional regulator